MTRDGRKGAYNLDGLVGEGGHQDAPVQDGEVQHARPFLPQQLLLLDLQVLVDLPQFDGAIVGAGEQGVVLLGVVL